MIEGIDLPFPDFLMWFRLTSPGKLLTSKVAFWAGKVIKKDCDWYR